MNAFERRGLRASLGVMFKEAFARSCLNSVEHSASARWGFFQDSSAFLFVERPSCVPCPRQRFALRACWRWKRPSARNGHRRGRRNRAKNKGESRAHRVEDGRRDVDRSRAARRIAACTHVAACRLARDPRPPCHVPPPSASCPSTCAGGPGGSYKRSAAAGCKGPNRHFEQRRRPGQHRRPCEQPARGCGTPHACATGTCSATRRRSRRRALQAAAARVAPAPTRAAAAARATGARVAAASGAPGACRI